MRTSRALLLLSALLLAGCANDNDYRTTRYQWHDRARYLADESRLLSNEVRDHLVENERWEPRGRDVQLWDTTLRIRSDAYHLASRNGYDARYQGRYYYGDSRDGYYDGENVGVRVDSIRRIRQRVGYVRRYLATERVSRTLDRRLTSIDAILWAMENEGISDEARTGGTRVHTGRPHPPSRVFTYRQPVYRSYDRSQGYGGEGTRAHGTEDYVRYSEPYVGAIRSTYRDDNYEPRQVSQQYYYGPQRSGVASHAGQSEYIRSHSAARSYVTRQHGVSNSQLQTTGVEQKGDRYVVKLQSASDAYEVSVDGNSGAVLQEKARRR